MSDLGRVRWRQPADAACPMIHAQIRCYALVSGWIPHECVQRSAPHAVEVWVLKRHTVPAVFARLTRQANEDRR